MTKGKLKEPVDGPNYYKFFHPIHHPGTKGWDELGPALEKLFAAIRIVERSRGWHTLRINQALFGPQEG